MYGNQDALGHTPVVLGILRRVSPSLGLKEVSTPNYSEFVYGDDVAFSVRHEPTARGETMVTVNRPLVRDRRYACVLRGLKEEGLQAVRGQTITDELPIYLVTARLPVKVMKASSGI